MFQTKTSRQANIHRPVSELLLLCFILWTTAIEGKKVAMKIVDETHSSEFGFDNNIQEQNHVPAVVMRIKPSNFSGPPHLHVLYNKCFTKIDDSYKYEFCPFSNVTQHEQSLSWNPYSGVLGVWQEWEIENNTYTAMLMREGDVCGQLYRSVRVELKCGESNHIDKVTEPSTCNYLLTFKTPYVCHPHAMLVYPTLTPKLRLAWDKLEGQLAGEIITQKGYKKKLHKLFVEAGLELSENKRTKLSEQAVQDEKERQNTESDRFDSLTKCNDEYQSLKQEISRLKEELAAYRGNMTDIYGHY